MATKKRTAPKKRDLNPNTYDFTLRGTVHGPTAKSAERHIKMLLHYPRSKVSVKRRAKS